MLEKKIVAAVYSITIHTTLPWCKMLSRNKYASIQFMHPNGISSFFWPQKHDFCWILTQLP